MSLVEAVILRRIVEKYGPLPRAEHFAELRDGGTVEVSGQTNGRDPWKLTQARKRYYERNKNKAAK
jgi:hypothetical protein